MSSVEGKQSLLLEDAFKRLLGFTPIVGIRQVFAHSSTTPDTVSDNLNLRIT
jgi:hypothetical protein